MTDIDFEKVAKKLKNLRIEQGITQEQIASDIGTSIAFISNIENNRTKLNLRMLLYYSNLCHVTIDYLLNTGITSPGSNDDSLNLDILSVLNHYSFEEKIKVLKMLKIGKELN